MLGLDTAAALRAILRVKSIESKAETMQPNSSGIFLIFSSIANSFRRGMRQFL